MQNQRTSGDSSTLVAALCWIERGFHPIPVPDRQKAPNIRGWQRLRLDAQTAAKHFNGSRQNIGVIVGDESGLADVDCDCHEAIAAARKLLPPTESIFGRNSKPFSHYFYRCAPPICSKRYIDPVTKRMLIELRCQRSDHGIGLHTIVPPSVHTSGEQIRFEVGYDGTPRQVDAEHLARAVACTAAASLAASHWPANNRHDCEMALAGVLARSGWTEQQAMTFVVAVYTAVASHDRSKVARVERSVRDTFQRFASNSDITGYPTFTQHVGSRVASRLCQWLNLNIQTGLEDPTQRHPRTENVSEGRYRFICDEAGIWAEDTVGNERKQWIGPPLEVVARTHDFNCEGCGKQVTFRDWHKQERTCILPLYQLVGDSRDAVDRLLGMGYQPRCDTKALRLLKQYIYESNPSEFVTCAGRVGWHGNLFVLPHRTIGDSDKNRVVFHSEMPLQHKYAVAGTADEWESQVSRYCSGNSRLLLAVSSAFAAPLLEIVKSDGGGVHFRGASSTGKTTALLVAGSVLGGDGERGFLETWRATASGMETRAMIYNHMLLPLDEIGEINEREAGDLVYILANGGGKGRATRTISLRPTIQFKLLFLSTGERTLADVMTSAGKQVKGGQEARLIEIEADAGLGYGVFERLHEFASSQEFALHLSQASRRFYGTAILRFLEHLVVDRSAVTERVRRGREEFLKMYVPGGSAGEVCRVASLFGVIAAAGEEATILGITGWKRGEAWTAAARLFSDWIHNRGGTGAYDVEAGINSVRAFLNANPGRFQDVAKRNVRDVREVINRAGFRSDESESSGLVHYVFPHVFEREICNGYDHKAIAREMARLGQMKQQSSSSNFTILKRIPNQGRQRFYAILPALFEDTGDE